MNISLSNDSDDNLCLATCAKPWCKKEVPRDGRHKACNSCREHDRLNQRKRRLAIKSGGIEKIGHKRKRTTSLSSVEDRPSTRNRPDSRSKNDKQSEPDSSDDEKSYKPNIVSFYSEFALSEKELTAQTAQCQEVYQSRRFIQRTTCHGPSRSRCLFLRLIYTT